MKKILDYQSKEVVNIYDEVSLWSAPFGRLLLENIPMSVEAKIVDIGFGTGFPLIELSQRFGEKSQLYGIDIWKAAIQRTQAKIDLLEIKNIEILEGSAAKINLGDDQIDLVTSNLGVNNFEEKEAVYFEIKRILKQGGRLCITTNPMGTFEEFFEVFGFVLKEMKLDEALDNLETYLQHRSTESAIISEIKESGLQFLKSKSEVTQMRFVCGAALMNHSLIRVGFRAHWEKMVEEKSRAAFFERLTFRLNKLIMSKGEFVLTIPMLYLEFEKS